MDSIDYVIMAIGSIITFYIELFAYAKLSNNKYDFNFKNIVIPIVGGIIVIFNIYTTDAFIRAFYNIIIFTFCAYLIFRNSLYKTIIYTGECYIIGTVGEILLSILVIIFKIVDINSIDSNKIFKIVFSILDVLIIYGICSIKKVKTLSDKIISKLRRNDIVVYIFLSFLIILIMMDYRYIIKPTTEMYVSNILVIICLLLILIFSICCHIEALKEKKKTIALLEFMSQYEIIIDEDRINRHEMLNNLIVLKTIENKNSVEYESILNEFIKTYSKNGLGVNNISKLPTGLKGIIYYKMYESKNKNIIFNISISKQISTYFKKIDNNDYVLLCRIVNILLDNSIEASMKSKNKVINIEIYSLDNDINIVISNSFKGKIDINRIEDKYYSTKGSNRGIGLYLMRRLINDSDIISLERRINNKLFETKIIIKSKQD